MAVIDKTVGTGVRLPNNESGASYVLKYRMDTATTNVANGSVLKLFIIPADTLIKDVIAVVRTAEGTTLTIDVGDYVTSSDAAVTADGWLDGINGNSAAATHSTSTAATYGAADGKYYSTNLNYIGVLFNNAAATAVIDIQVFCVDCADNIVTNTY